MSFEIDRFEPALLLSYAFYLPLITCLMLVRVQILSHELILAKHINLNIVRPERQLINILTEAYYDKEHARGIAQNLSLGLL